MSFAEDIKNLRKRLFLTQERFAKEIGVSFASVNRWEGGKSKPNLNAMKSIKEYCNTHKLEYDKLELEWLKEIN